MSQDLEQKGSQLPAGFKVARVTTQVLKIGYDQPAFCGETWTVVPTTLSDEVEVHVSLVKYIRGAGEMIWVVACWGSTKEEAIEQQVNGSSKNFWSTLAQERAYRQGRSYYLSQ